MFQVRMGKWTVLAAVAAALALAIAMPLSAFADTVTTHDADEIRAALASDGDTQIVLDGDVSKEYTKLSGGETTWCTLGSGNKSIDLAGYRFDISVNNHNWHNEVITLLDGETTTYMHIADTLYMISIPAGAALTVDDSSGENDGEIMFDGYMHSATNGAAGTHGGSYLNTNVLYRNVFRVDGGDLTFNGGCIDTRSKEQYLSPGRVIDSLLGGRIDEDVWQQVNCVGITMLDGNTTINGGVIRGRGYRHMFTCPIEYGAWGLNEYIRAAAVWAQGGNLVVNDGEFEGKGGSNVLEVGGADSVTVRAGSFTTHKLDQVLVPCYVDGVRSDTGAPRYMNGSYGTVGLDATYLDAEVVDVYVSDSKIATSSWNADNLDSEHDVDITPKTNAPLTLIDGRNSKEIEGREIVWDGTSSCYISVPVDMTFDGYPWLDSYWVAVAESTKSNPEGTSPTIYMGGQQMSAPDAATVEKTVGYNSTYPEVQTIIDNGGTGWLSFDLLELKPDGIADGESFIVDFIVCQNLQPYNKGGYTQYLNRTRAIVVTIEPTDPEVVVQPEGVYEEDTTKATTWLSSQATGATEAWYVEEWPTYQVLTADFDPATGYCSLEVPITNSGTYYTCYFRNEYGLVKSDTVCVRYALNTDIVGTDTEVTMYTEDGGGDLIVTGDLYTAFVRVKPDEREVHWYKEVDGEWVPYNYQSGNSIIPSTPHYHIGNLNLSDAGVYKATVKITMNGTSYSFETGTYTVTVIEGARPGAIERIDLYGIGKPHLGDVAPGMDDVTTGADSYSVSSLRWNAYPADREVVLTVPESYYEVEFAAADGYHFEYSTPHESRMGIPVYVDGTQVGWADSYGPGQDAVAHFSYAYFPVTLTPSTGLEDITFEIGAGGEIDDELKSAKHFTDFGLIEEDAENISSAFASSDLPSWVTLSSDGKLSGTAPSDLGAATLHSNLSYLSASTGDATTINSGITFVMLKNVEPTLVLPTDASSREHVHTWGEWTDNGDGTHSRTCATCGGKDTHEHEWDEGETIVEATESSDGTFRLTCTFCGAVKDVSSSYELHEPVVKVDEVPATCTTDGTLAHYVCEECGLLFWDAQAKEPILDDDVAVEIDIAEPDVTDAAAYAAWYEEYKQKVEAAIDENAKTAADKLVIPATGHDWGEWTTVTAPTATAPGVQQRVCKNDAEHKEERACFLVSYDLNGGTLDGKTGVVELVAGDGEVITLPAPTRSGYVFSYWQGSTYYAGDSYTVEGNHTFTAQWTKGGLVNTGDATPIAAIAVIACVSAALAGFAVRRMR